MSNSVNLSLDVTKTGIQNPLIKVRQGDGGFETLHTTVTSNGEPLDLQGWTITFMGTTAGNHKIVDGNVSIVEAPNGIFDYTPSKAWGMDIGEFQMAYFKFVKGDGSTSSANFRVSVIEAVDITQEEAQNYISVVDNLIEQTRQDLTNSLASVSASIAATSSAAGSLAVSVSNAASNAVNMMDTTASSAVNTINTTASSAVVQVSNAASSASSVASSVVEKVNGVAAQVNALLIGGRNYLLNSSGTSLNGWGNIDALWSVTSDSVRGNVFTSTPAVTWTGGGANSIYQDLEHKLVGSQVIVSFWAKSSVNDAKFHSEPQGGATEFNPKLTTSWARYSYTIPSFSGTIYFMAVDAGTTYYLDDVKLEIGNIATDWTPSPYDAPSNDANVVHNAGTETIAGDKTFTGVLNATGLKVSGDDYKNVVSGSTNYFGLTISFVRIGKQVTFTSSYNTFNASVSVGLTNNVLPSGFRPALQQNVDATNQDGANKFFSFDPSGSVYSYSAYTSGTQPRISGTYITTDAWPV